MKMKMKMKIDMDRLTKLDSERNDLLNHFRLKLNSRLKRNIDMDRLIDMEVKPSFEDSDFADFKRAEMCKEMGDRKYFHIPTGEVVSRRTRDTIIKGMSIEKYKDLLETFEKDLKVKEIISDIEEIDSLDLMIDIDEIIDMSLECNDYTRAEIAEITYKVYSHVNSK